VQHIQCHSFPNACRDLEQGNPPREEATMTSRRLCTVLAVAAGLVWLTPAHVAAQGAGSPEAVRAANELVLLLSKDLMGQMTKEVTEQAWPQIERILGKMDKATMAELRREFEVGMTAMMADVMQDAAPIYARHFTEQELRDILAFYRTPTGVKALQRLPQVLAESMAAMTLRLEASQERTMESFMRILRERGHLREGGK
jgi:hypothetical protein